MPLEEKKSWLGARCLLLLKLLGVLIFLALVILIAVNFSNHSKQPASDQKIESRTAENASPAAKKDVYLAFLDEIYDKIKTNYWKKITDVELTNLYRLAVEKTTGQQQTLLFNDQNGLDGLLKKIISFKSKSPRACNLFLSIGL